MKLKEGFVLRDVAGSCVVVPTGADINFNGMISLNDTGKTLWQRLDAEATIDDLVDALTAEYDVDRDTAKVGAERFVEKLRQHGFIEE
ncbi:MAG: PqqD family protein [Clostridia bacterium]|nr:PqqD family protein [Clostridia bacterium]